MSLQVGQIQETPGSPLQAIWPHTELMHISQTVNANTSALLVQTIGAISATGNDIIHGATPIMDGSFNSPNLAGGCLGIFVSYDGIAFVDLFMTIHLLGGQTTFFGVIELPSFICRIRLYNNDTGANQVFQGIIRFKAV